MLLNSNQHKPKQMHLPVQEQELQEVIQVEWSWEKLPMQLVKNYKQFLAKQKMNA
jgi:hypothetical protein